MKTDREHWKKMLPFITAFANGETVAFDGDSDDAEAFGFSKDPYRYSIVKPKERVPLEAEDWIEDGPWWVRMDEDDKKPVCVVGLTDDGLYWFNRKGMIVTSKFNDMDHLQRRNATSDWMPCWKEKE